MVKGIIHDNWDSDIVIYDGELEKLVNGEILQGEICCFPKLGELLVSVSKDNFRTSSYFKLEWESKNPLKYHFKLSDDAIEIFKRNSYVHGRYEDGMGGSKLGIYGEKKDIMIKENIEFSIEMRKLDKKED